MRYMGWDEEQLHSARTGTIAEIAAIMREQAEELEDA
jgi:hypothetical protein